MADYIVTDTDMKSVADAIRKKTGSKLTMNFPTDFVSNIKNIPSATKPYTEETYDNNGNLLTVKTHGNTDIRQNAYENCSFLTKIEMDNDTEYIRPKAFYSCTKLATVFLSNSLISIGADAFWGCSSLSYIAFPANLKTIEMRAFSQCTALALFTLPQLLESIGEQAFMSCRSLGGTLRIPPNVKGIDDDAFAYCSGLSAVTFLGKPNSISATAFEDCNGISTINVPWAEGAVAGAPWGATEATVVYNYTGN